MYEHIKWTYHTDGMLAQFVEWLENGDWVDDPDDTLILVRALIDARKTIKCLQDELQNAK